jgi:hypothetical protein
MLAKLAEPGNDIDFTLIKNICIEKEDVPVLRNPQSYQDIELKLGGIQFHEYCSIDNVLTNLMDGGVWGARMIEIPESSSRVVTCLNAIESIESLVVRVRSFYRINSMFLGCTRPFKNVVLVCDPSDTRSSSIPRIIDLDEIASIPCDNLWVASNDRRCLFTLSVLPPDRISTFASEYTNESRKSVNIFGSTLFSRLPTHYVPPACIQRISVSGNTTCDQEQIRQWEEHNTIIEPNSNFLRSIQDQHIIPPAFHASLQTWQSVVGQI